MMEESKIPQLRFPEFEGEWGEKKVGDFGKISMCKRILKEQTSKNAEIPFYKIGTFGKETDTFIEERLFEEYKQKYSFPKTGDILISAAGTIGRTVVFDGRPAYFQDSNIVWVDNDEKTITNEFLAYCYQNVHWITENTTIKRLYNDGLRKIKIFLPQLPEQQKIATFLTAIDKRIQLLEKKKTALEAYKKGVMQKIFSQEIRFKAADGNDFEDWEEKKLGDLGEIITGKTPKTSNKKLWNGTIDFITPTDISEFKKYQTMTARTVQKTNKLKILPNGTIVYTCIASIGKMALTTKPSITNQQINSLVVKENISKEFVYYALLQITSKIKALQANTTLPIINKSEFSKFKISIPFLAEQQKIANFLSAIDQSIEKVAGEIEASKMYKKGLLQQLFV